MTAIAIGLSLGRNAQSYGRRSAEATSDNQTSWFRSGLTRAAAKLAATVVAFTSVGCYHEPVSVLQRMSDAQRLAGKLRVDFTQASNASNLAVMAQSDITSAQFADEAKQKIQAVQQDVEQLQPLLGSLMYSGENQLLGRFNQQLTTYRTLDQDILKLAVANDNLKAQRLSFGPAQKAADDFHLAVEKAPLKVHGNPSQASALAFQALAALREIQVLEAPHIAEARDEVMTSLEKQMAAAEAEAASALQTLAALTPPNDKETIDAANNALNRFLDYHRQTIKFSRYNSNVRSLALSLGQRRRLTADCEDTLEALTQALDKRGFHATR